jgi:seryl-tRNA synthetase
MLEIKLIRQNLAAVEAALATRGQSADLEAFKTVDAQHRQTLQEVEELRHRRNVVSDEIARLKRAGDPAEAFVVEMRAVSARIKVLEKTLAETQETLSVIPRTPSSRPGGRRRSSTSHRRPTGTSAPT